MTTQMCDRLLAADGRWFRTHQARRIGLGILAIKIGIIAIVLLAVALKARDVESAAWVCCHNAAGGTLLLVLFGTLSLPAVMPFDVQVRRLAKHTPIPQRSIVRRSIVHTQWFSVGMLGLLTYMFVFFLLAGSSLFDAAGTLAWQCAGVWLACEIAYVLNSQRGRWGLWLTLCVWSCLPAFFVSAKIIENAEHFGTMFGRTLSAIMMPLVFIALACTDFRKRSLFDALRFRPNRHRIRKLLESWRAVPDYDSPALGHLNFPKLVGSDGSTSPETYDVSSSSKDAAASIREAIVPPSPSLNVEPAAWRRYMILAAIFTLAFAWASSLGTMIQLNLGGDVKTTRPAVFGIGALMFHIPAVLAGVGVMQRINPTIVSRRDLLSINFRSVLWDSFVISLLLLPNVIVLGYLAGDFQWYGLQLALAILASAFLRCTWFLYFPDIETTAAAMMSGFSVFFASFALHSGFGLTISESWCFLLPLATVVQPRVIADGIVSLRGCKCICPKTSVARSA